MRNKKTSLYNTTLGLSKSLWKVLWLSRALLICVFVSGSIFSSSAQIQISSEDETVLIGKQVDVYYDESGELGIHEIAALSSEFERNTIDIINAEVTSSTVWVKLQVENLTNRNKILLELRTANVDDITLYQQKEGHFRADGPYGQSFPFKQRYYNHPHFIFDLDLRSQEVSTYYLSIKNKDQTTIPLQIGTSQSVIEGIFNYDVANGVYLGIFLVMFLYNLSLYFTTRNKHYIYYSVFVLTIGVGLFTISGYSFKYLWPNSPGIEIRAIVLVSAAIPIAALLFADAFLNLRVNLPRGRKVLIGFIIGYAIVFVLALFGAVSIGQKGILGLSLSIFFTFGIALYLTKKGIRAAKFYLAAWSIYLVGIIVFILKDVGVLPYNWITTRLMHFGSAMEVLLLSFALGDYINTLRAEKEASQKKVLEELQRNEQIIKEQNVILEKKVSERTYKLEKANLDLNQAMHELKDAQIQLVDAEKMASLGQLTAGIAHEINNPINFVTANVLPLTRDIDDLKEIIFKYENSITETGISLAAVNDIKEHIDDIDLDYTIDEITQLLAGIKDGADRTAEIVKGLKNFSRLDESAFKDADINEGISSTLLILKSKSDQIGIEQNLGDIDYVTCLPGKLNQLFMNVLDNAIYACNKKNYENEKPLITVITTQDSKNTNITFKDNGIGMNEETVQKIFEPFFTTKDVGEGTGLGMSIAHGILTSHKGVIKIYSELGKGTEIIINLPRVFNNS